MCITLKPPVRTKSPTHLVAAGALDIHEVRVGRLHESLQLAFAFLFFDGRVKEIFRERHGSSLSVRSCWGKISTKKVFQITRTYETNYARGEKELRIMDRSLG